MNIWDHCLLSQRKFGGQPGDYEKIHSFMDSSKYFFYHNKHRLLIHNLFGVELATELLGNFIENSDHKKVLVRDVAIEHCREDLDGKIPTLYDWLKDNTELESLIGEVPDLGNDTWNRFLWRPFLRSELKASLIITCSDFGVFLMEHFHGLEAAKQLARSLDPECKVKSFLEKFRFTQRWQYTPQQEELEWLRKNAVSQK
ncbi:hypothetical protein QNI19_35090 [Cytophagaceae bacterium DM2B3-1]|uniref:DUF6915 domain-containing protein n=1 Tax=Xanthocytophaga flava TaxID=3048013 RepID=A0ABT7CWV7_9BACT|nr:hypothetical protein [Xanthocytophaga flavus]MDJ1498222.1 hypothetical protein [Xanthocytophaga flavus]